MPPDRDALIRYRIQRAHETEEEARMASDAKHWHLAENRIYYSMFYLVHALALQEGVTMSRHAQLVGWFNKTFVHAGTVEIDIGKIFQAAFEKRQEGDYDDFVTFSPEEVADDLKQLRRFFERVETMFNLTPDRSENGAAGRLDHDATESLT